ncbi:MAG TPA: OB-fold domain-containing protein [Acidimicrobiales bacterium]
MADSEVLRAPHVLEYPYVRSVGPVIGAFLTGLRDGRILGAQSRDASGAATVIVPPTEYDPVTSADVGDLVEVGQSGVVTTWSWAAEPKKDQPLDRPFAWALVQLDGSTTGMLHVVDAGSPDAMSSGMRVTARWRPAAERQGRIQDIECFVPEGTTP